ncbi:MFS transporter [Nostoc sp. FACHB-152]|uniref:MFS transporter n=1 Tax=unclassified Nostoc TaxID=2593658 RepID=UPI001684C9BC|nr:MULTISPECIES: MFS transporter [unclassified Nostoc]MBD2448358.1 MFS transporter [Nostoc sp. FACHB-152]MBD2467520.1 MFS transporter [Nostoc sp. FACHB-145]
MDSVQVETAASLTLEIPQVVTPPSTLVRSEKPKLSIPKDGIRTSLQASTMDAVLATVFTITTSGILLSNFLVELKASPVVFGLLCSIPMLVNLIQPLGAYLSERTTSRFRYAMGVYGTARLVWLILAIAIAIFSWGGVNSQQLVVMTLLILLASNLLGGLGSASWLSWLAMLVPRRLRGSYFGFRNSAISLTNLICLPLAGLVVSHWYGGTIQGYGVLLLLGVAFGVVSIGCQYFQVDINPQLQNSVDSTAIDNLQDEIVTSPTTLNQPAIKIWKNVNFLIFLIYISLWMFSVHLCAPFFNLYMLDTLGIDVSWVTLYGSLQAGANLLMMIWWGKLADRVGNLPILLFVGILVGVTPILWLGVNASQLDIWLWLPLLHILAGATWAAIDLCNNNLQLAIAPMKNQSIYFAIAAAVAGASGALGTTIGSFIAQFAVWGGLLGLFALSGLLRLAALVPLFFVQEPGR